MERFLKFGLCVIAAWICLLLFVDSFTTWKINKKETPKYYSYVSQVSSSTVPTINPDLTNSSVLIRRRNFSFFDTFTKFPWDEFEEAAAGNDTKAVSKYTEIYIEKLAYFLKLEPLIPINATCTAPELLLVKEIDCTKYPKAFTGVKRKYPAKIGALLLFGFDVDVLEIHLNELNTTVDLFFLVEATNAQLANLQKPLMWEHVKTQIRFKNFPVVHFIVDEAEASKTIGKTRGMENMQEKLRWEKFLEWNAATKYFNDDDVIGFGDTDEIPSRDKVQLLRYCEFSTSIDFGIWFPYGRINQAFQTDYPVNGHPLTLGDPTYFKLSYAKSFSNDSIPKPIHSPKYPSRLRGGSPNYLLGGMHMTHYSYLPYILINSVTATEATETLKDVQGYSKLFKRSNNVSNVKEIDDFISAKPNALKHRIRPVNLEDAKMKEICILPWFYDCNRKRYPVWEGGHDTRLD